MMSIILLEIFRIFGHVESFGWSLPLKSRFGSGGSYSAITVTYINNFSSLDLIDQRAHDSHPFNGITRCEDLSLSEDDSPSSHYKIPFEIHNALFENFFEEWFWNRLLTNLLLANRKITIRSTT